APGITPTGTIGIGDDAAVIRVSPDKRLLVTTDLLIEGVHFDLTYTDFYSLGWKSAAVNLSDIAAMGGIPRYCLTAIGISPSISVEQIADFYRGFNALLKKYSTALVGGDTCSSRKGFLVSVTALGEAEPLRLITRDNARPGDRVFVTGTLGDSAAGLEILKSRVKGQGARGKGVAKQLRDRHLRPMPRMEWGRKIARSGCANAMIDISDGLSSDLGHICEQSGVGAKIRLGDIPISRSLKLSAEQLKKPLLHYALSGGEDYELLFTVPEARLKRFVSLKIPATEIGMITRGRKLLMGDTEGSKKPLQPEGYDHFARSRRSQRAQVR
ncbi:MAG TPA: thiamine-phosphate kinase, partial [Nitrospirota bacterium]